MRRKDREMNKEFGLQLIDKADFGVLSMNDQDQPYSLPLSFARKGEKLYFHSAQVGRKVDFFKEEPFVTVVFVGEVKVPELYTKDQLDEIIQDEKKAIDLLRKVFTTEYESCIVHGRVRLLKGPEEVEGHHIICEKFTPTKMDYFEAALKVGMKGTNTYAIDILKLTAKRKKYDHYGEEMKFGRMK